MTEADWIKLAAETLVGICGIVAGFILAMSHWVATSFERLVNSVNTLNTNVALVVEKLQTLSVKTDSNERRIERLEEKGH